MLDKIIAAVLSFLMMFSSTPLSFYNSDSFVTSKMAFPKFYLNSDKVFEIPEICGDFVPQGLCYSDYLGKFLVTGYMNSGGASPLYVVNPQSGAVEKKVFLYESQSSAYTGHAGGIAAFEKNAWVVSGQYARRLDLSSLAATENGGTAVFSDEFNSGTRASYISCANGVLWVGEYYKPDSAYNTDEAHHLTATDGSEMCAFNCGYVLESGNPQGFTYDGSSSAVVTPDFILATEEMCQGFAQLSDGRFVTSISGSALGSELNCYDNVLKNQADTMFEINGVRVPLWFLDSNAASSSLRTLPRSEGMQCVDGKLYVLYESAAEKMYCKSLCGTKYVWAVDGKIF